MSELSDVINEMRNMRESYNQIGAAAEAYNAGKVELAENITAKGIPASATETLPELAEKVGAIAQTQTILEGGEVMAAQQFGDGALWNLYQVLADMKTRFMGTGDYSALIVCEYYKGYDSLQLQGADGYYTCDGDLYEYASPNHVWHDADNGKMNRWVAFLYRDEGARLDITNTAISPRSMYIGGHIGTIEYFVNGRLTELVGCVEETDYVDYFLSQGFTQEWGFNCILRGVKHLAIDGQTINTTISSAGTVVLDVEGVFYSSGNSYGGQLQLPNATTLFINRASSLLSDNMMFLAAHLNAIYSEQATRVHVGLYYQTPLIRNGTYERLIFPNTTEFYCIASSPNLIDLVVGELDSNTYFGWNPTNVLADVTKKAQLIENIKNHILARISDATGGTQLVFTVSTDMYNSIASEIIEWQGETMSLADAFLTKNWLLAGS